MVITSRNLVLALFLGSLFFFVGLSEAQSQPKSQVERWGVEEVTLHSTRSYANPVTDVKFSGRFTSPSGKVSEVKGFFDGDGIWLVRFMPEETGSWTYSTISNNPDLNGKSGAFTVVAPSGDKHGPVHVAKSYHFDYANGTPYFLLGTTTYGGLSAGPLERAKTMSKLAHSPFNKTRFFLLSRGSAGLPPFELGEGGRMDFTRPNPAYFREVEAGLRELSAMNVQADVILWNYSSQDAGPANISDMTPEVESVYLEYVVSRFAAFNNVWWTMSNEFDLFKRPKNWKALGELVQRSDPYHHPISIHQSALAYYDNYRQDWLSHIIIQDLTQLRLPSGPRNLGALELDARKVGKPVVVDEYGYEGNNGTTYGSFSGADIVEMHWSFTMSGAYGSHGETYGGNSGWEFVGDAPARLGFLKQIMTQAPFQEMEPANDLVAYNGPLYAPTMLAKRGAYYLLHIPPLRHKPDWNPGAFGPGTPSNPLPLREPYGNLVLDPTAIEVDLAPGIYKVELIDTWQMRVAPIGYVQGGKQTVLPRVAPGVVRFVAVPSAPEGVTVAREFSRLGPGRP